MGITLPRSDEVRNSTSMSQSQSQTPSEGPTDALKIVTSFVLTIETTNSNTEMKSLHVHLARYDDDVDDYVDYTPEELAQPGFVGKTITLVCAGTRKTYENEKGFFTVKEVVDFVEDFERISRPKSGPHGGIDCHHIFFEGLAGPQPGGYYTIIWGS